MSEWFGNLWREVAGHDRASRREILVLSYAHGTDQGEPSIGFLGKRWVRRSAEYWARRVLVTAMYLVLALAIGSVTLGLAPIVLFDHRYWLATHLPLAVKILIVVVWSLPAVPAYLAMYRRLELYGFQRDRTQPAFSSRFLGARYIIPLAIPFFPILGGMILAMGAVTLRRDFPGESAARDAQRMYQELVRASATRRSTSPRARRRRTRSSP